MGDLAEFNAVLNRFASPEVFIPITLAMVIIIAAGNRDASGDLSTRMSFAGEPNARYPRRIT